MEDLTAQLDHVSVDAFDAPHGSGPSGNHWHGLEGSADQGADFNIDLGDASDLLDPLNHDGAAKPLHYPDASVEDAASGPLRPLAAIVADGYEDDDNPLADHVQPGSLDLPPPYPDDLLGRSAVAEVFCSSSSGIEGHHPFTYGQIITPPVAPSIAPFGDPALAGVHVPHASEEGLGAAESAGDVAGPLSLDPLSRGCGDSDDDVPGHNGVRGSSGVTSASVGGSNGRRPPPLSAPPAEDEVPLVIAVPRPTDGSATRLQYTVPPEMQRAMQQQNAAAALAAAATITPGGGASSSSSLAPPYSHASQAAGPSSSSASAAVAGQPFSPLSSPGPGTSKPRMSQRSLRLSVTISEPLRKEQAGLFGLKAGCASILVDYILRLLVYLSHTLSTLLLHSSQVCHLPGDY